MRTKEVISKVRKFRDYYGFDIAGTGKVKTKEDCLEALKNHKDWLEDALADALMGMDQFIEELGIGDLEL